MAGYNRDIVATRNLNKRNKARLRSTGDTELGFINGSLSHINRDEKRRLTAAAAYDISLRERVEDEIAREGAGTINPFTGMREYHEPTGSEAHDNQYHTHATKSETDKEGVVTQVVDYDTESYSTEQLALEENIAALETGLEGYTTDEQLGYGEYGGLSDVERASYLGKFDITPEKLKFISPLETKPFEFLQQGAALEREQLGTTFGRGYKEATAASQQAISQSGLASSGTITSALGGQMKALTQDLQAGMKTSQFGLEKDIYTEQQRQMDKLWQQVGIVSQK